MAKQQDFQKTLRKLWKNSLSEYEKMTKETSKLLKKGEKNFKQASTTSKKKLELVNCTVKREKLYYQLGKSAANTAKSRWTKSKKITSLITQIKDLNKEIKKLNKQK